MNIHNIDILQLLPPFMREDAANQGIAEVVSKVFQDVAKDIPKLSTFDALEKLNTAELDELAEELNVLWYDKTFTDQEKRILLAKSDQVYARIGTVAAVEDVIESIFGSGFVEEFWEYGGEPHHFKIAISNPSALTEERKAKLQRILEKVKRKSQWLDEIYAATITRINQNTGMKIMVEREQGIQVGTYEAGAEWTALVAYYEKHGSDGRAYTAGNRAIIVDNDETETTWPNTAPKYLITCGDTTTLNYRNNPEFTELLGWYAPDIESLRCSEGGTFANNTNLHTIGEGAAEALNAASYALRIFQGCTTLKNLPANLTFENLQECVAGFNKTAITSLPAGMTLDNLTNGSSMFQDSQLAELPAGMTLEGLQDGGYMFCRCPLKSVSQLNLASLTNGEAMFRGYAPISTADCQSLLDSLPDRTGYETAPIFTLPNTAEAKAADASGATAKGWDIQYT